MAKLKGNKIDGMCDVMSVFGTKDGLNQRLMAVPAKEGPPCQGTFYRIGDRVFTPKRRRGEKFRVIYTVITEVEF